MSFFKKMAQSRSHVNVPDLLEAQLGRKRLPIVYKGSVGQVADTGARSLPCVNGAGSVNYRIRSSGDLKGRAGGRGELLGMCALE